MEESKKESKKVIDWFEVFKAQEWDAAIYKKIMAGSKITYFYSSDNERKK